jgi:hypothetical protein
MLVEPLILQGKRTFSEKELHREKGGLVLPHRNGKPRQGETKPNTPPATMKVQDILDAANALVCIGWEATLALFTASKGHYSEDGNVGDCGSMTVTQCTDTDNGANLSVRGTLSAKDPENQTLAFTDFCPSDKRIREFACSSPTKLSWNDLGCASCSAGQCQ